MRNLYQQEDTSSPSPKLIKIAVPGREAAADRFGTASELRSHWKRVGVTAGCGIAFGLLVAAAIRPSAVDKTLMVVSDNGTSRASIQATEISRLEIRNRRLETLVEVLRSRFAQVAARIVSQSSKGSDKKIRKRAGGNPLSSGYSRWAAVLCGCARHNVKAVDSGRKESAHLRVRLAAEGEIEDLTRRADVHESRAVH